MEVRVPELPLNSLRAPRQHSNPFHLTDEIAEFEYREREIEQEKSARFTKLRKSLVTRNNLIHAAIPPLTSRGTIAHKTAKLQQLSERSEPTVETARPKRFGRMEDFIKQKRETYYVQLIIDRRNREIQKLQSAVEHEESALVSQDTHIAETSNHLKMLSTQIELELARAQKEVEATTCLRAEKAKELKLAHNNLALLQSEISKNEEQLQKYHQYNKFLRFLAPEKFSDHMKFYTTTETLLEELEQIEKENLFLIDQYQAATFDVDSSTHEVKRELTDANRQFDRIVQKIQNIPKLPDINDENPANQKKVEDLEQELHELTDEVTKVYQICFGGHGNVSTLGMLERIENSLESMYLEMINVDEGYVRTQQTAIDHARRESARKLKAEQQEYEQRLKMEHALARATKPIKKKVGRPVIQRAIPYHRGRKDEAKEFAYQQEQQRQEQMLYGDVEN